MIIARREYEWFNKLKRLTVIKILFSKDIADNYKIIGFQSRLLRQMHNAAFYLVCYVIVEIDKKYLFG